MIRSSLDPPVVDDLHRVEPVVDDLRKVEAEIRSMQELMEGVPPALQSLDPLIELSQSLDRAQRAMRQALEPLEEALASIRLEPTPDEALAAYGQALEAGLARGSLSTLQEIERTAQVEGIAEIAASLQERLGQRATAYLSGVKDAKMVGRWARGKVKPRELAELRLRAAYPAAALLVSAYGPDTARAWFFGTNTRLGGEAPAYLLRHGQPPFQELLPAARAFVQGDVS